MGKEDKKGEPIMHDDSGLTEWSSDIRGMVTFARGEDITPKVPALRKIIGNWLSIPS